jgi:hypothetical protein
MAGTISFMAGAAAEVLSTPVGSSAKRTGMQHAENRSVAGRAIPGQPTEGLRDQMALDAKGLAPAPSQGRSAAPANKTTMIFERDDSGRMYLYIRDKRTGEEVIRIPRKILGDAEPKPSGSRLDIRV